MYEIAKLLNNEDNLNNILKQLKKISAVNRPKIINLLH